MRIKILSKKAGNLRFLLDGANPALANALRRIMIAEVPTMAVDWIDVEQNESVIYDEMVAHRLSMIPIVFDPKKFSFMEDCKCGGKGCPQCQVVFALEKTGPTIACSGDLKVSSRDVKTTDPRFPIVELLKTQSIKLDAVAKLGVGMSHAKWQAANASYQYYPEQVESGESRAVRLCPKGALKASGNKASLAHPEKCDLCECCFAAGMKIKGSPSKFIFNVESVSGLEPEYIVSKAIDILAKKGEEFKRLASKL